MGRIVTVRHPVPATCVPRGCRNEWTYYRRHATPVRLREADPADAVPLDQAVDLNRDGIHDLPRAHPCVWHDGRVWAALGPGYRDGRVVPFDAAGFEAWLSADADGTDRPDGLSILDGSPLWCEEPGGRWPRGTVLAPRDIRHEGGWDPDAGSLALTRFMDERVRLVGGVPHLRLPGPIWCMERRFRWSNWVEPTRLDLIADRTALTAHASRLDACCEVLALKPPRPGERDHGLTSRGRPVEDDPADDLEDMRVFANAAARSVVVGLMSAIHRWKDPDERLMEPYRELLRWESLGFIGAARAEDAPAIARAIAAVAEAAPAFFPHVGLGISLRDTAAYATRFVLPLLAPDEPLDDDDLAALGGLSDMPPSAPAARVPPTTAGLPLFDAADGGL